MEKSNKPFWIIDSAIIFKPSFNDSLDDYTDIISNYRILIFSNYDDPHTSFKNKNIHDYNDYKSYSKSLFIHQLDNCLLNLLNLEELMFGDKFDIPLNNSLLGLTNLRKLTFGWDFDQPLNDSLLNLVDLRELTFGHKFNQQLCYSLSNLINLIKLTFGYDFNKPINGSLSKLVDLRKLTFGYEF